MTTETDGMKMERFDFDDRQQMISGSISFTKSHWETLEKGGVKGFDVCFRFDDTKPKDWDNPNTKYDRNEMRVFYQPVF